MDNLKRDAAPKHKELIDALNKNGEKLVQLLLSQDENNEKLDIIIKQKDRQFEHDSKSRQSSFKVALLAVLLAGIAIYIDTSKLGGDSAILNSITSYFSGVFL